MSLVVVGSLSLSGCARTEGVEHRASAGSAAAPASGAPAADPGAIAAKPSSAPPAAAEKPSAPAFREVVVPAGTTLSVELASAVASDSSRVEDPVRGTLRKAIVVDGLTAIPAGARVAGHVTEATRAGRVKGRARVAFRFSQLDLPGDGEAVSIRTGVIAREAAATKKQDALKIGGGAAGGAVIGGILGGGDGAAKGAAIGGAAGTGVVLATRGKEVQVAAGTPVSVKLLQPVTLRVKS